MKKNIDDIIREIEIPDISDGDIRQEWQKVKSQIPQSGLGKGGKYLFGKNALITSIALIATASTIILLTYVFNQKNIEPATSKSAPVAVKKSSAHVNNTPAPISSEDKINSGRETLLNDHSIDPKPQSDNATFIAKNRTNTLAEEVINTPSASLLRERSKATEPKIDIATIKMSDSLLLHNISENIPLIKGMSHLKNQTEDDELDDKHLKTKTKINVAQMIKPKHRYLFGISLRYVPSKLSGNINFWNQIGAGISIGKRVNERNYLITGLEYSEYNIPAIAYQNESFASYSSGGNTQYASDKTWLNRVGGLRIPLQYKINNVRNMSFRFGTYIERSLFYYGNYYYYIKDASGNIVSTGNPEGNSSELKQLNVRVFPNSEPFSPYRNINVRKYDVGLTFSMGYTPTRKKDWEFSIEGNYGLVDFTKTQKSTYYNKYFVAIDIRKYLVY